MNIQSAQALNSHLLGYGGYYYGYGMTGRSPSSGLLP